MGTLILTMVSEPSIPILKLSNYFYNRRWQNYPRRFVPILHRNGAIQTKTYLVSFVAQIKIEDHMFLVFWFVPSSLSYGPKRILEILGLEKKHFLE